jgi:hypothetical protein
MGRSELVSSLHLTPDDGNSSGFRKIIDNKHIPHNGHIPTVSLITQGRKQKSFKEDGYATL